jgi:hypothetical protein
MIECRPTRQCRTEASRRLQPPLILLHSARMVKGTVQPPRRLQGHRQQESAVAGHARLWRATRRSKSRYCATLQHECAPANSASAALEETSAADDDAEECLVCRDISQHQ